MACQSLREPKMTQELGVTSLKGMEKIEPYIAMKTVIKTKDGPYYGFRLSKPH